MATPPSTFLPQKLDNTLALGQFDLHYTTNSLASPHGHHEREPANNENSVRVNEEFPQGRLIIDPNSLAWIEYNSQN